MRLSDDALVRYRRECTGEKLGWVIYESGRTFVKAHRIHFHPEDGPVLLIDDEVLEIDPDAQEVYRTEDDAKEAYYKEPK